MRPLRRAPGTASSPDLARATSEPQLPVAAQPLLLMCAMTCWQQRHVSCPANNEDSQTEALQILLDSGCEAVRLAGKALPDRPLAELSVLEGSTALHFASKRGDVDMVRQLVLAGADVQIRNAQGKRPIDVARTFFGGQVPQALAEALLADPEALSTKDGRGVAQEAIRPPRKHFRFPFFEELSTSDDSDDSLSRLLSHS
eukprot:s291_g4.t1